MCDKRNKFAPVGPHCFFSITFFHFDKWMMTKPVNYDAGRKAIISWQHLKLPSCKPWWKWDQKCLLIHGCCIQAYRLCSLSVGIIAKLLHHTKALIVWTHDSFSCVPDYRFIFFRFASLFSKCSIFYVIGVTSTRYLRMFFVTVVLHWNLSCASWIILGVTSDFCCCSLISHSLTENTVPLKVSWKQVDCRKSVNTDSGLNVG